MLLHNLHRLHKRRKQWFRLRAEEPEERLAVLPAPHIELTAEPVPHLLRPLLSDTREKADEAKEGKFIRRIHDKPEIREHVLRVDLLENTDTRGDTMRNAATGEGHLNLDGLEMAAVQNRDIRIAKPVPTHLCDDLHNLRRLRLVVIHTIDPRLVFGHRTADRLQNLLELIRRVAHHHIRDVEDTGHGTVISFKLNHSTALPALRKLHNVLNLGSAPGVDALKIIADREDVAMLRR